MKKVFFALLISVITILGVFYVFRGTLSSKIITPIAKEKQEILRPLEKYSFASLRQMKFPEGNIEIGDVKKEGDGFVSRMFYFYDGKRKVSGLMNLPLDPTNGPFPVIIMNRGFVEKSQFTPGEGTRRTAEEFAKNGFITLAPDFLGYGESDMPSSDAMEERFQTYTTDLSLLASVSSLNKELSSATLSQKADLAKIGLWGHSNGGHITLAILEITGKAYPTVLWAPVSKPFPYSILYYTDEYEDHGKALRKLIARFEETYDVEKFSETNYFTWIKAPIELHQGVADESVPLAWSDLLDKTLRDDTIDVTYFTYPGENHNFNNGSWGTAVTRSMKFYTEQFANPSDSGSLE